MQYYFSSNTQRKALCLVVRSCCMKYYFSSNIQHDNYKLLWTNLICLLPEWKFPRIKAVQPARIVFYTSERVLFFNSNSLVFNSNLAASSNSLDRLFICFRTETDSFPRSISICWFSFLSIREAMYSIAFTPEIVTFKSNSFNIILDFNKIKTATGRGAKL